MTENQDKDPNVTPVSDEEAMRGREPRSGHLPDPTKGMGSGPGAEEQLPPLEEQGRGDEVKIPTDGYSNPVDQDTAE